MREVEGVTLYTIREAADVLGVTAQTVRIYIKANQLKAQRIGRPYLISGDSLKRFVSGEEPVQAKAVGKNGASNNGLLP